jgi:tetratricopeptide (TPR) repeat protein
MRKEMDAFPTAIAAPTNINPEDAAKLAALGYIGSTSNTSAATGPLPDPKDHIGEINLMREGSRAEAQHDFDKAITDFKEVVRLNPHFADAWNKLGAVYEDVGRYDEALASYQEALKSSPELTSEYAITIGYLLRKMKRYDDAAAHAQLALKQNPAGAHNLLGWIAYDRHDFATAEREAQQAAEDPSFHMRASVLRARVLTDTGRPADALNLLSTLDNEVNEKHLEPVESLDLARASAFMALERPGDAEAALQREITHFPANLQAYANLAVLYMITGHPDASNAVLQRMTEQNPTHSAYLTAAVTVEAFGDKAAGMRWRTRANGE